MHTFFKYTTVALLAATLFIQATSTPLFAEGSEGEGGRRAFMNGQAQNGVLTEEEQQHKRNRGGQRSEAPQEQPRQMSPGQDSGRRRMEQNAPVSVNRPEGFDFGRKRTDDTGERSAFGEDQERHGRPNRQFRQAQDDRPRGITPPQPVIQQAAPVITTPAPQIRQERPAVTNSAPVQQDAPRQEFRSERHESPKSMERPPMQQMERRDDGDRNQKREQWNDDRRRHEDRYRRPEPPRRYDNVWEVREPHKERWDNRRGFEHDRRPDWVVRPRHVERVYHPLPPQHSVFLYRNSHYHYHEGRFYRPFGSSFILVRPPAGLVVFSLPFGFRTVISSGMPYYVYGDVYYRRVPNGYEVVEPIRTVVPDRPEWVTVNTELLNVRYAPDDDEEVIAQVTEGMELKVLGSAPGWLYVEIPDEDIQGWVMEEYVSSY